MDPRAFARVKVFFGKPGQTQIVTSGRKAGEILTDYRWPVQNTPTQERAVAAIYGALDGKGTPAACARPSWQP